MQDALFDVDLPESRDGWVYAIGAPGASIVKIGTSIHTAKRLQGIQTSSPVRLEIRWQTPGGRNLERALHDEFRAFRRNGEWFDFGDLDPVMAVRGAAAVLGAAEPMDLPVPDEWAATERAADERLAYTRFPASDDPDRDDPAYQPNKGGCRFLTPKEVAAAGEDPEGAPFWCFCGQFGNHAA